MLKHIQKRLCGDRVKQSEQLHIISDYIVRHVDLFGIFPPRHSRA